MKTIILTLSTILICANSAFAQLDSIYEQGGYRTFKIHLPAGYSTNNQYPIVLNLHGLLSNGTQQQSITQFDNIADSKGFLVLYPNATGNLKSWATIGNSDVDFLSNLVDTIRSNYSANNCLFVTGFSNGGFMTYKFANNTPHTVSAIAIGSGNMSNSLKNTSTSAPQIPVMHFHGTTDNTVPYNGTSPFISPVDSTIQWWVQHNNCNPFPSFTAIPNSNLTDSSTVEKYYYGDGTNGSEVTFYKVLNGGHTWSGATPIPAFGSTNQDINQSTIIANFFDSFCTATVGINEENSNVSSISLYPNPFDNQLIIQLAPNTDYTLILYDNLSRQVLKERFYDHSTINTDYIPNGIYFYEIRNAEKLLKTGKVIKH
ncbi:MAG: hypothetical protein CMP53_01530 [Flavobacteriales bacterium]|jgi:polyhydroxybutyrate depolymerase|nr:hypothetical protein [Flavobacteriales bacterium]